MFRFRFALIAPVLLLFGSAACHKSEGTQCVDDRTCGAHMRCNLAGRPVGICQACGPVEIPYNGMDDDCDPRTRDIDLDSDGYNAKNSPVAPGDDCDDMDPLIHPG